MLASAIDLQSRHMILVYLGLLQTFAVEAHLAFIHRRIMVREMTLVRMVVAGNYRFFFVSDSKVQAIQLL